MTTTSSTVSPVPTRARPFELTQKRTPLLLKKWLGRELAPSRDEFSAVLGALSEGDAQMDALVSWMVKDGGKAARAQFAQALEHGVDSVESCPAPLREFFEMVETVPDWVDFDLVDEGAAFIQRTGLTATYILRDLALMGGYLLSGFNQSLVMTGALNKGASRRVAETAKWWVDCTEEGGLKRGQDGYKSTLHVRLVHAMVRRSLANRDDWDAGQWGVPLSQVDMVATYLAFCVVMMGGLRKMGIPITPRESRAVMHLWKYACWLMGVDTRWLVDTEKQGVLRLYHTLMTQSAPDWTSAELGAALAAEPLERYFARCPQLQRQWAYHRHLSVSQYFLGSKRMKKLGLPGHVLSWYPLLTLVPRAVGYSVPRVLPVARTLQQQRGRRLQRAVLGQMFGEQEQGLVQAGGA